jgi:hypothetical protein
MGSSYERQITLAIEPEDAGGRIREVLSAMPRVRQVREGPEAVTASARISWWSWGEKITVRLAKSPGGTEVVVRSQCKLPTQSLDWGKNERNVNQILQGMGAVSKTWA